MKYDAYILHDTNAVFFRNEDKITSLENRKGRKVS